MSESKLIQRAKEQLLEDPIGDASFLEWVADRFVYVYGASGNVDYVLKLRSMARAYRHLVPSKRQL